MGKKHGAIVMSILNILGRITIANTFIQPSSPHIDIALHCVDVTTLHIDLYGYARIYNIYHTVTWTNHKYIK